MPRITCCKKDCENRSPTCHISCQPYIEQSKASAEYRDARNKEKQKRYNQIGYMYKAINNMRSKTRRKLK